MTNPHRPVVVGIDGTVGALSALRFGLAEAQLLGASVLLTQVVADETRVSSVPPVAPSAPGSTASTGSAVLLAAEARAHEIAPDVVVGTSVRHGMRVAELCHAAEDAAVLVVGRDDGPLLERLVHGSTATGVAARATVPVVSVPAGWQPSRHGRIVVGVRAPEHAAALLEDAFTTAAERRAVLVVVHSWHLPGDDDVVRSRSAAEAAIDRSVRDLQATLHDLGEQHRNVSVETRVVHARPTLALVEAARSADLLLVARRSHHVPGLPQLGGTARTVLRSADCPVRVVPPRAAPPDDGLPLERAGALVR